MMSAPSAPPATPSPVNAPLTMLPIACPKAAAPFMAMTTSAKKQ